MPHRYPLVSLSKEIPQLRFPLPSDVRVCVEFTETMTSPPYLSHPQRLANSQLNYQ